MLNLCRIMLCELMHAIFTESMLDLMLGDLRRRQGCGGFQRSADSAVPSLEAWRLGGLMGDLFCLFVRLFVLFCWIRFNCLLACFFGIHECDGIYRSYAENHVIFAENSLRNRIKIILGGPWGSKIQKMAPRGPRTGPRGPPEGSRGTKKTPKRIPRVA